MEIRQIKAEDADILSDFYEKIADNKEMVKLFHPHPFTKEYSFYITGKVSDIKDAYFIGVEDSKIAGYAMLRGWDEGYEIPSFGICILPEYQGKGLGKQLMSYAISLAKKRGSSKMMLKVYKDNEIARRLYSKTGFKFTEETPDKKQLIGFLELNDK